MNNCVAATSMAGDGEHGHWFDTQALRNNLSARSVSSGVYALAGEGLGFILQLGSIAVLARLLLPEHFGLVGMVAAITAIAERFKDLGLSIATVQRRDITHAQVSTLFWINVGFGLSIATLLCASAQAIAWFYSDDRLFWIVVATSGNFLFGGLVVQHQALLKRQMHFGHLTIVNLGATLLGIGIAVVLALKGYGYWALVWKELARNVCIAIGSLIFCPWLPGRPRRGAGVRSMLHFGKDVAAFNLIEFFTRNLDQILIGKFFGALSLGIYRQANQLMQWPLNFLTYPLHSVAEPALSALQGDPGKYRAWYMKVLTLVSFISMPLIAIVAVHSENFVLLLLGDKWIEAAEILGIVAVGAFLKPALSTCGFVMLSCGQSTKYLRVGLISAIVYITFMCIGLKWGIVGVAIGYSLSTYVMFFPLLHLSLKETPVNTKLFLETIWRPMVASIVMAAAIFLVLNTHEIETRFVSLLLSLGIGWTVYLTTWLMLPGGRHTVGELLADGASLLRKA